MVLLIACVNVAILLLSRAAVRRREMALRRSLGASRGRLVRQGLAESLILAAGGAGLGILLGAWADRLLSSWLPASVPRSVLRGVSLEMNWRVAAFTAVVAVACAVLFSLAPALEGSSVDLIAALKTEAGAGRGRGSRQRGAYVVVQVALSLVLLVSAGLLLRALGRTSEIDPGFATGHRIYLRLFTPEQDFTPEASTRLFTRMLAHARSLPGVRDATLSYAVLGFTDGECVSAERGGPADHVNLNVVEPNYFGVMEIRLSAWARFCPDGLAAYAPRDRRQRDHGAAPLAGAGCRREGRLAGLRRRQTARGRYSDRRGQGQQDRRTGRRAEPILLRVAVSGGLDPILCPDPAHRGRSTCAGNAFAPAGAHRRSGPADLRTADLR